MTHALKRLQQRFEEDPVQVLAVAAAVLTSTAMCMNAYANLKSRRTWAQEVNRRDRMSRF